MQTRRRPGFTIIEMMAVIAIIAMFVGMLLPAVQQARSRARQVQCVNNLRQLGVALANYEHAHLTLPPGVVNATGPIRSITAGYHMSWIAQILPQLEQRAIYDNVDFARSAYHKKNARAMRKIPPLHCPSTPFGFVNYAACHHHTEAAINVDQNGVMFLNSSIAFDDVADGLSSTIMVGEKLDPGNATSLYPLGWMYGTRGTLRNTGNTLERWDRAAVLTPGLLAVGGFGSSHAASVNFVFCDGSVRPVSFDIDTKVLQNLGHRRDGNVVEGF